MLIVKSSQFNKKFSNTQISVPEDIVSQIQKWGKEKIAESKVYTDPKDSSFGRETDSHITVKFGLHTNNLSDVQKVVANFGEIAVKLGNISKFSSDKYDVIKIDVISDDLHKLNALISDELECTDTHPAYKPHLTISYVQKGSCDKLLENSDFTNLQWSLSEIEFHSQNGKTDKISIERN